MKKLLILLFCLSILMTVTTPDKANYVSWLKEQALNNSEYFFLDTAINLTGDYIIESNTTTQNFVVFSIFETKIPMYEPIKFLGMFNNFIPLSSENSTNSTYTDFEIEIFIRFFLFLAIPYFFFRYVIPGVIRKFKGRDDDNSKSF